MVLVVQALGQILALAEVVAQVHMTAAAAIADLVPVVAAAVINTNYGNINLLSNSNWEAPELKIGDKIKLRDGDKGPLMWECMEYFEIKYICKNLSGQVVFLELEEINPHNAIREELE